MWFFHKLKNKLLKEEEEVRQEITIEEFKALGAEGLINCRKYRIKGNHLHYEFDKDLNIIKDSDN